MTLIEYARRSKRLGKHSSLKKVWIALAGSLDVTPSLLKQWAYQQVPVSSKYVIKLERASGGRVKRQDSRPDLYPDEDY
jgi:DNA-binding transcriptional regulator YdaS (Cro superfamily)